MISHRRTFLKQLGFGAVGVGFVSSLPTCHAALFSNHARLPRSAPEAQGVSSEAILGFLEALGKSKHEFHSFMMLRHGHVITEGWWSPYRADLPHMLYSLSKSFTSTSVGFAVTEKRISVDDYVTKFFPDDLPEKISDNLAALQVKHLLTMSVGHAEDSTGKLWGEQNWAKKFLSLPIQNLPGSAFLYNSGATYMLSAIVQKVTGEKIIDYLKPRLFVPLEIQGATWETCPRGINTGGWGLKLRTEALAKFGQLYLQKGNWKGKQILPAAWVDEATTFKIQQPGGSDLERLKQQSDWHQGYCYQFWRCRHNAFRGDGAFGQFTIVMPEQDAVIAITSESPSMQGELDLVWDHLLPAMKEGSTPANRDAQKQLTHQLASLALSPSKGQISSPTATRISGRQFKIETNKGCVEEASLSFQNHACVFALKDNKGQFSVTCGLEKWVEGQTSMPGTPPKLTAGDLGPTSRVAASGTWTAENTFEMTWRFIETPHHDTVTCHFDGDNVKIEFLNSLTKMTPSRKEIRPALVGKLA
jgi:CubicO group peptidase (beta-lactamase class C family)